ncbi:cytochrome c oxidase assembly protein [Falsirhodobacter sp. 1013]|uniref:cytochrome c oxidase assembly protein n=1 Tax=Falsirhodobacter sp. 1013 TaxID=3417566 RepID=UPI003EBB4ED4
MHHPEGGAGLFLLFTVLPLMAAALYFGATLADRKNGNWPWYRSVFFCLGVALVSGAMSPPMQHWAHHDLRGHMAQHLMLGMFAPLGLVLAAPGTLLLRRLPVAGARRVVAFLGTRPVRVLVHPVTAAVLDVGGMYGLYLTPLYTAAMESPALHFLLHVHFVVAGCLFTWAVVGPDPAPHRPGWAMRLGCLFAAMAAHAVLGKIMFLRGYPSGTGADLAEIEAAAQWMYYGGDVAEVLLACAFFAMWRGRSRGGMALFARS